MNDPRSTLLLHNSGHWLGCFFRLDRTGKEQERFCTSLEVKEAEGLIQTCLTYKESGRQQSMNFEAIPSSMQVTRQGHWSTGPNFITPWNWVAELCVVNQQQRRRMIVRHGASGLDRVIYIVEAKPGNEQRSPSQPLHCQSISFGSFIQTETSKDNESRMLTRLISMLSTIAIEPYEGQVVDTPFH